MQPLAPDDARQIGPYRLVGRLGAGGMGRVYLGISAAGRAVAVKVIHPTLAMEPAFARRFQREVSAARAVSSVYTAAVVAAEPNGPSPWLATVFVPGPSLTEAVDRFGKLPESAVWRLSRGLVEALRVIHSCGLIHRDFKPSNILLAIDGPRVIDFGISRAFLDNQTTARGTIVGTPAYMSPEQVNDLPLGPATDIFSLGSVLAFAATGRELFGASTAIAELYRVANAEPDLADVPVSLRELLTICLAKNPHDRPTPTDLAAAIREKLSTYPDSSSTTPWPESVAALISSHDARIFQSVEAESDSTTALHQSLSMQQNQTRIRDMLEHVLVPAGHVFISYAREDTLQVDQLQHRLEAAGVPVWRDTAELWPGEDWRTKIRQAIVRDALVFIACFSEQSLRRERRYQNEEIILAVEQMRMRQPDVPWLIPVRFDECEIPDRDIGGNRTLASIHRADLFGPELDDNAGRLVKAVLRILGRSEEPVWTLTAASSRAGQRLNLTGFMALSAAVVASQLSNMAEDEAVLLLATAPVEVSADVIDVLLSTDEGLAMALLSRLNRGKAKALIAQTNLKPAWLDSLPIAADAIARRHAHMRSALGAETSHISRASSSPMGTEGFCQTFERGQICWTRQFGTHSVRGAIEEHYLQLGGSAGKLGFPIAAEEASLSSAAQRFNEPYHWYEFASGHQGSSDSSSVLPGPRHRMPSDLPQGLVQLFEGGAVFHKGPHGPIEVTRAVADLLSQDDIGARLGFPTDHEAELANDRGKRIQFFEYGVVTIRGRLVEAWFR